MKNFLIFGLFLILGFAGFLVNHLGAFKPVQVEITNIPAMKLIGKKHIGPYHTTVKSLEVVEKWMLDQGYNCNESFGLYLDDPEKMESERLQSFGGCLVKETELKEMPKDFQILEIPSQEIITAQFDGSPGIGPLKVYPMAEEFRIKANKPEANAALEIYEIIDRNKSSSMKTKYFFLLELPEGLK